MANLLEIANAEADDKFVITLNASKDRVIFVQSIEFIADFARTRVSLSRRNRLDEFFCPEVADELSTILMPALERPGMVSLPDHKIQLSDVLLEGCRVIVMAASGGGENIIVRFRKCYGAVFSVLNENVPLKKNLVDKSVAQSIEMLENAYIPLFDLSRFLDGLLDQGEGKKRQEALERDFSSAARSINDKIKSLEMYNFFLKRYLETPGAGAQSLEEFARARLREMSAEQVTETETETETKTTTKTKTKTNTNTKIEIGAEGKRTIKNRGKGNGRKNGKDNETGSTSDIQVTENETQPVEQDASRQV